jgi:SAM-dependent methyltransferase
MLERRCTAGNEAQDNARDASTAAARDAAVARLHDRLRAVPPDEFAQLLLAVREGRSPAPDAATLVAAGRDLGILEADATGRLRLTAYGSLASDSLREHLFWRHRGRTLHFHGRIPALRPERLAGKRVLEIGCGAGVNLLTLQQYAGATFGIEIEPTYLTFARAMARLEGRPEPSVAVGAAEHLELPDAAWDVVLYMGSLQYMDYERALREAARVLAPGGRVVVVQSRLGDYARLVWPELVRFWRLRPALRHLRTLLGSLVYPIAGRALLRKGSHVSLTSRRMLRYFAAAGLSPVPGDIVDLGHETCYVAEKPAGAAQRSAG